MDVDKFKAYVTGIQRATLFEVEVYGGNIVRAFPTTNLKFTCKSASVPSSTFGVIEVPYMGRKIKFNGDRTYEEWQTTVIIDNNWNIYNHIFDWHSAMNDPQKNVALSENMNDNKGTAIVKLLSNAGNVNFAIKLVGFFPHALQPVELGWDQNDTTADLAVSWSFDYALKVNV